jgi:hypothetical protein
MKALRYHGPGNLSLDDIDDPVCGKDQVKVIHRHRHQYPQHVLLVRVCMLPDKG